MTVRIVLKQDQRTGRLTQGVVKDILTRSAVHPHGIKVRLQNGLVGRVKDIVGTPEQSSGGQPAGRREAATETRTDDDNHL